MSGPTLLLVMVVLMAGLLGCVSGITFRLLTSPIGVAEPTPMWVDQHDYG